MNLCTCVHGVVVESPYSLSKINGVKSINNFRFINNICKQNIWKELHHLEEFIKFKNWLILQQTHCLFSYLEIFSKIFLIFTILKIWVQFTNYFLLIHYLLIKHLLCQNIIDLYADFMKISIFIIFWKIFSYYSILMYPKDNLSKIFCQNYP